MGNVAQPLDPALSRLMQQEIDYGYERFLNLVSKARNMSTEEVDKIAQGRVWAGSAALELGLVDYLGNLEEAIERAAKLAEIDEFTTYYPSQELDWRQQLLESFSSVFKLFIPEMIRNNIIFKESINSLQEIETLNDPKGLYVRCEDCLI